MICYYYTIEFQKRGAPHCHMLIKTDVNFTSDNVDTYVKAEIPDKKNKPILYKKVLNYNIHKCSFGYGKK